MADREADFYDLFAAPRRPGSHLLIRAKPRRRVRHVQRLLGRAVRAARRRGRWPWSCAAATTGPHGGRP